MKKLLIVRGTKNRLDVGVGGGQTLYSISSRFAGFDDQDLHLFGLMRDAFNAKLAEDQVYRKNLIENAPDIAELFGLSAGAKMDGSVPCGNCYGTGELNGECCPACGGEGKVDP